MMIFYKNRKIENYCTMVILLYNMLVCTKFKRIKLRYLVQKHRAQILLYINTKFLLS